MKVLKYSISEISELLQISAKTLIRHEALGKIPKAKRDWRGWRTYTEEDLKKLAKIYCCTI